MNFFDYDLTRQATATPPAASVGANDDGQPSLNEEVNEVVGQLGRLWGGFRKQSQTAFEIAKKDLSSVVAQAQKEIEKLSGDAAAGPSNAADQTARSTEDTGDVTTPKGNEETLPSSPTSASASAPSSTTAGSSPFQSILAKVQSSLPPNLSQTIENTIPAALKDPHVDLASLRASLGAEFARVQGVTRAQAEEYAHRSEVLLREAGEYLKDAVRVLPPEGESCEGHESEGAEVMIDPMGLGVVVMPPGLGTSVPSRSVKGARGSGKGKEREGTVVEAQRQLAASRAAALVAKLKQDVDTLRQDPRADPQTKEMFETWYASEVTNREGGVTSAYWIERTKEALAQEDSDALKATRDSLVTNDLDPETFWTHYFFRLYQIGKDEEKRRALLLAEPGEGTDEDFSWEDDDDESAAESDSGEHRPIPKKIDVNTASGSLRRASCDTLQPAVAVADKQAAGSASYPESLVNSPSFTGSRASSEGYDVVSAGSGAETKRTEAKKEVTRKEEEEDGDSDWE